jgi:hypothetical protein
MALVIYVGTDFDGRPFTYGELIPAVTNDERFESMIGFGDLETKEKKR